MTDRADDRALDDIERRAFDYFRYEVNDETGLVRDNTRRGSPATIAGSGFALSCYAVGAERGYVSRADAGDLARRALRFLAHGAAGSRGFFYHFIDLRTGERVWDCELSTIDSTMALAGALAAGVYFDRATAIEREIRTLADALYRRAEWNWALGGSDLVSMGWRPESGFLRCTWRGYTEALLLYILGLGSPTHPLPPASYTAWTRSYRWLHLYGQEYLYAGPLFIHQLSQTWIDFRGIRDAFMGAHASDYFENSRRATYAHREYAHRNPHRWDGFSALSWGVTASDGPGPARHTRHGRRQRFYGYHGRGVPYGIDDGTLSPWAMVTSLPFAPDIVLPSMRAVDARYPQTRHDYGYIGSFNPSVTTAGWFSPAHYAINQGPVMLMIENYRSELLWRLMRRCPYIVTGLRRAGFTGGWLS